MDTITDRHFYVDTETPQKVIDSVQISIPYHYMTGYNIYEVKDKLQVEGGEIDIKQKEDNKVVVAVTGRQEEVYRVFALNNEGKPLRCYHSRFEVLPKDYYKNAGKYAKALRKVEKKAGNAKTAEDLKSRVKKALKSLPSSECEQENCMLVYTGYCEGNVESVLVYFLPQENRIIKERVFTLENSSRVPPLLVKYDEESNKYGLANEIGEYVMPPTLPEFFQINDFYYAMGDLGEYLYPSSGFSLYYLDTVRYEFIELPGIMDYIDTPRSNSIAIKKGDHYALWDENGIEKTEYLYDFIEPWRDSELYFVRIGDYYGLIDSEGEIVLPIRYSYIGSLNEEGVARAEDKEKREVYIDRKGRVVTSY